MKKAVNIICVILGFLCFGIGAVGAVLPILPSTPFLLLAAALFAKGSMRFHKWFMGTVLYRKYIDKAVKNKAMGKKEKRNMLITLGVIFTVGIVFSPSFAKVIIVVVAVFHFYYFIFRIRTLPDEAGEKVLMED
ncbi:MAG: YbaN family protein [Eubacteriales bacterium]|nr:YbaN family protein [Eubacteriales bacterium]